MKQLQIIKKSLPLLLVFGLFTGLAGQDERIEEYNEAAVKFKENYDEIKDLKFVGGGDFNTISQNGQNSNTANISVGFYYRREFLKTATTFLKDIELDIGFNIASTADTLIHVNGGRDFGNFILNPINNKQSARLDMYSFFKIPSAEIEDDTPFMRKVGIGTSRFIYRLVEGAFLRFYGSSNFLMTDQLETNFTALQLKIGFFQEFMPNEVARKENISLMLGVAYSSRMILGDIVQNEKADLLAITNDTKNVFNGLDVVFSAKFNDFRVEFIVPFIFAGDTEIKGLTNTQFITQFRFLGGFNIGTSRSVKPIDF